MNPTIQKLAVESGLLNYVDNETPRHYFLSQYADTKELEVFSQALVRYLVNRVRDTSVSHLVYNTYDQSISEGCKHAIIRKLEELL